MSTSILWSISLLLLSQNLWAIDSSFVSPDSDFSNDALISGDIWRIKRSIFDDLFGTPTLPPSISQPPPSSSSSQQQGSSTRNSPNETTCGSNNPIEPGRSYSIKTPFYDWHVNYPLSSTCSWDFMGTAGCIPMVDCGDFNVVQSTNCTSDYLEVSDGVDRSQKFCGTAGPRNVSSGISIMKLRFKAGPFQAARGFGCIVSCGPAPSTNSTNQTAEVNTIPRFIGGGSQIANCTCGVPGAIRRIVGGSNARPEYWRWQTAILIRGRSSPFCGGALISDRHVLTAAHCVLFTGLFGFPFFAEVKFNEYDTTVSTETKTVKRDIVRVTSHPFYNPQTQDYDIAILEFYPPLNLTSTEEPIITPVCLPARNTKDTYVGLTGTAVGWGTLTEGGDQATTLQQADIPIISNEECGKKYESSNIKITPRMMCAAYPQGGVDSCQGDSGGPFNYSPFTQSDNSTKRYTVIGVVSFGEGCARSDKPGVYARVTDLNDWVRQTASGGTWCQE